MSITGNIKTMQLAELLQWLSQSQKTGTLVIEEGKVEKRIYFNGGQIVSSSSNDPSEYLGNFLVNQGLITEDQLDKAVKQQESQKMLLGKILVTSGAVSEADLDRQLRRKAEETIYDIFTWPEGDFRFLDGELPEFAMVPMKLDVTGLMMEGARRVDEWNRIRDVIPSRHCVPVSVTNLSDPTLDPVEQNILAQVDDERTIEEIGRAVNANQFLVSTVLYGQTMQGKIKVVKPHIVKIEVPVEVIKEVVKEVQVATPMPQYAPPPQGYAMPSSQMQAPPVYAPPPQAPPQPAPPPQPQETAAAAPPAASATTAGGTTAAGGSDALDPEALLNSAAERLGEGDLARAVRYLRSAGSTAPDTPDMKAKLAEIERQIRAKIEREGIKITTVPKLAMPMDQLMGLDVSAQEGFILTRVDGSYDLKSITKISPMGELDILVLFWRMKKDGHVTV
jgi:hypothetical protein